MLASTQQRLPCAVRPSLSSRPAFCTASRPACMRSHGLTRHRSACVVAAVPSIGAEPAKRLIEKEGYKVLDIRSSREYDEQHITKPALSTVNVPLGPSFVSEVSIKFFSKAAKLIVMCQDGGASSDEAVSLLQQAAYTDVLKMEKGYTGWAEVWTPSGKRRPPPGRWVSTGKEALKSGLNIPGVAESYDEGGNLIAARYAKGLDEGQQLPPSSTSSSSFF